MPRFAAEMDPVTFSIGFETHEGGKFIYLGEMIGSPLGSFSVP